MVDVSHDTYLWEGCTGAGALILCGPDEEKRDIIILLWSKINWIIWFSPSNLIFSISRQPFCTDWFCTGFNENFFWGFNDFFIWGIKKIWSWSRFHCMMSTSETRQDMGWDILWLLYTHCQWEIWKFSARSSRSENIDHCHWAEAMSSKAQLRD